MQGRIYTRKTWAAAQGDASKRAAKIKVYVHFSSKFLNINFQYLKTKIYFYSLKTCIISFFEVIEERGGYSSLPRAPSSVNPALTVCKVSFITWTYHRSWNRLFLLFRARALKSDSIKINLKLKNKLITPKKSFF